MSEVKKAQSVRDLIWQGNPLLNFDSRKEPEDLQGWGSEHHFFEPLIEFVRPSLIIEVGSWKGASAIRMAKLCQRMGLQTEIVCVDTWLGSAEHFLERDRGWFESLRYQNGYPALYRTFAANVIRNGLQNMITPLPLPSESASVVLGSIGVQADLIYIDGAHEYVPALRDISDYWSLLKSDGIMLCDDYGGWPGVTKAVNEFAAQTGLPIYTSWGKAFMPKGGRIEFTLELLKPK